MQIIGPVLLALIPVVLGSAPRPRVVLNGPAGAACSGTLLNGQPYSGVQSWSTNQGRGYWACFTRGTSGFKNPHGPPVTARAAAQAPASEEVQPARAGMPRPPRGEVELRDPNGDPVIVKRA